MCPLSKRSRALFPISLLCACVHAPLQAHTYAVGVGVGCTHATVQAALDTAVAVASAEPHLIKLSAGSIAVANGLLLHNPVADITIQGGYAGCDGVQGPSARTTLDATGGSDGTLLDIRYFGSPNSRIIRLARLDITGGTGETGPFSSSEGAGLELRGNLQVFLEQGTRVQANRAVRAAGILMQGGPGTVTLNLREGSSVSSNIADSDGGGIWCINLGLVHISNGTIEFNEAGRDGGGIWLGHQCGLRVGGPLTPASHLNLFSNNLAGTQQNGRGGAVFYQSALDLAHPYDVDIEGVAASPVLFIGNQTLGAFSGLGIGHGGGALYLEGNGAARQPVRVHNALFANNSAQSAGSAISVARAVDLTLSGSPSRCDGMFGFGLCNAISGGDSDALYIDDLRTADPAQAPLVRVSRTRFAGNAGHAVIQSYTLSNAADHLEIDSSIFDGNDTRYVFDITGSLDLHYSTIIGNTLAAPGGGGLPAVMLMYAAPGQSHSAELSGSLIWQPGSDVFRSYGDGIEQALHNGCLLAHSSLGIQNPGGVRTDNPQLDVDFTPGSVSPALDVCHSFPALPALDAYGGARPIDQPTIPNALGAHDLGAVERSLPAAIFSNGFE
ncbi:MAG: hypothetical protein IPG63_04125 [Xanthomonadales bacterium]|nr:hypothetical protein [Xanthomonadales bacterium]MCC6561117.1 hypothetical protein [Xanthomonadales bacterium]